MNQINLMLIFLDFKWVRRLSLNAFYSDLVHVSLKGRYGLTEMAWCSIIPGGSIPTKRIKCFDFATNQALAFSMVRCFWISIFSRRSLISEKAKEQVRGQRRVKEERPPRAISDKIEDPFLSPRLDDFRIFFHQKVQIEAEKKILRWLSEIFQKVNKTD